MSQQWQQEMLDDRESVNHYLHDLIIQTPPMQLLLDLKVATPFVIQ